MASDETIYIDGLEAIGDISRKTKKESWVGKTDFSTTVRSECYSRDNRRMKEWNNTANTNKTKSIEVTSRQRVYKNSILNELQMINS